MQNSELQASELVPRHHRRHLLTVRAVETRRLTTCQTAQQRQLAAVVNPVVDDVTPHDVADRHRIAEEVDVAIEIGDGQFFHARNRVAMHDLEAGHETINRLRAIHVVGLFRAEEHPCVDPVRDVAVALGEMPRELAERSALGVWTEVIFVLRKRSEQFDRALAFVLPRGKNRSSSLTGCNVPPPFSSHFPARRTQRIVIASLSVLRVISGEELNAVRSRLCHSHASENDNAAQFASHQSSL